MKLENNPIRIIRRTVGVVAVATLFLLATATNALAARNPNPGVVPPGTTYRGLTYGEWGALWWTALFAIPVVEGDHPLFSGGAFAADTGVVFLAAVGGGAEIHVTIPSGASIFVPVVNSECSVIEPPPWHGDDEAELRACANGFIDATSDVSAAIDGVPVQNLDAYRVESPLFEFGPLPEDNLFGEPAGATSLSVDAGIYLMLAPLSPGDHSIHVRGTFDSIGYTIDSTFLITVK